MDVSITIMCILRIVFG